MNDGMYMRVSFALVCIVFPRWRMCWASFRHIFRSICNDTGRDSPKFSAVLLSFDGAPSTRHLVLSGGNSESRVIIVGDVHGCFDELKLLLEKCAHDEATDTLIFVGDLVNKGPKSAETVTWVRSMANKGSAYCVLGNHDIAALRIYDSPSQNWPKKYEYLHSLSRYTFSASNTNTLIFMIILRNDTLTKCASPREDIEWWRSLPHTIAIPHLGNALVVHAGLVPELSLDKQSEEDMTCMRNVVRAAGSEGWSGVAVTDAGGRAWADVWRGPYRVYFGHDATRGLQRQWPMAVGLDTGCCYGELDERYDILQSM